MESDKLIGKLTRWFLLLQEYDFEVVHRAGITNVDANGLSHNPSPSDEDLTGARWHGDCDREAVPGRHAVAYLISFSGTAVEVPMQSLEYEIDRSQSITNIWEDLSVLHKLQQGIFFVYLGNGKGHDWTSNNKVPLGEKIITLIVVGWNKAYCP